MAANYDFLRHTVATLAYRGGKVLRDAPPSFARLKISETTRQPIQIVAHIADLLEWGLSMARGAQAWNNTMQPEDWDAEVARFYAALEAFDRYLASDQPVGTPPEKLFQGPIADALTHVGQLAMLRRIAGAAIRAENYHKADIATGHVGREQPPPRREFD